MGSWHMVKRSSRDYGPPAHRRIVECGGPLEIFIADESSMRCRTCGFIGWPIPVYKADGHTIERYLPHRIFERDNPRLL